MQLLLIALATLASEDLTCIAAGVLVAQGKLTFASASMACFLGIFVGDLLLFFTGRWIGTPALRWPPLARFLSPAMVDRGTQWLEQRGFVVVFLSRFTPGLRLPTYFAAGMLPTNSLAFAFYFLLAAAAWTPLLVGAAAVFGEEVLRSFLTHRAPELLAFGVAFAAALAAHRLAKPLLHSSGRRRVVGFFKRIGRWEFWPMWLAYLPVVPYILYLGVRHRSLTLFTAANPGIPSSGFVGESKSEILRRLGSAAADFRVIEAGHAERCDEFPVVLKPEVGERGSGVAVIRSSQELDAYLHRVSTRTIMQQYVGGVEFGVFYYRKPSESKGRIFSITAKHFPTVTGDGRTCLRDLILNDTRAVCLAAAYESASKRSLDDAPHAGEVVQLVEIGSHCRGAVFLDATHLATPALEAAIEEIGRRHEGFYFGRYDIRTPSVETLQRGESIRVIELNGVSAEATHIYDPAVSLTEAYRSLYRQWRLAFEIGEENRTRGFQAMTLIEFFALVSGRHRGETSPVVLGVRPVHVR
jgi:membrane protein DedA with SNARE-associated domain